MDVTRLQEFVDLAETLSFSRSAVNLNMTQSTLSRHIADLEAEVGVSLFDRTTSSVKLTLAGKSFYEKATGMVSAFEDMLSATRQTRGQLKETVLVAGSTLQPTENRILTFLSAWAAARGLSLRLAYCKPRSLSNEPPCPFAMDLLDRGKVGLVVDTYPSIEPPECGEGTRYEAVRVCFERLRLIGSPNNPLRGRARLRLEDLRGMRLVSLAVHKHCPKVMSAPFKEAGMDPHLSTVYINDIQEIPERLACLRDDEVVFLQQGFCDAFGFAAPLSGAGVPLDLDDERARLEFWGVVRKDEVRSGVREAFALLCSMVEELSGSPEVLKRHLVDRGVLSSEVFALGEKPEMR